MTDGYLWDLPFTGDGYLKVYYHLQEMANNPSDAYLQVCHLQEMANTFEIYHSWVMYTFKFVIYKCLTNTFEIYH